MPFVSCVSLFLSPKSFVRCPSAVGRIVAAELAVGVLLGLGLSGGCAKDPDYAWLKDGGAGGAKDSGGATGSGGSKGSGGLMGSGGSTAGGGATAAACDSTRSTLGKVDVAASLISVGKSVTASAGVTNAAKVTDGFYSHAGAFLPAPTVQSPAWLAIDLGAGPERLLLSWADNGWNDYNTPIPGASPSAYRIETSADSTDGADGTWQMVVDVPVNKVRERAHTFAFGGKRWVRMVVTAGANALGVSIDELAVHDVSASAAALPADTWFFMGDSITAGAFRRQLGAGTGFDELIHAQRPTFAPTILNGGIGGELSTMGLAHVADWLDANPDIQHFAILYGTNDSWGVQTPSSANLVKFTSNMTSIVDMLIAAGRVPILARIPFATMFHDNLAPFNAAIDEISTSHGLPCGPDLYSWFRDHPEELSSDGVHPSDIGYRSLNRLWAMAMLGRYPAN